MSRRPVPELEKDRSSDAGEEELEQGETPVFKSLSDASEHAAQLGKHASKKVEVQEGDLSLAPAQSPIPLRRAAAPEVPVKRYRVLGLPLGGVMYTDRTGRQCLMKPNKILDERYFPIEWLKQQGFQLQEVAQGETQIGLVR